MQGSRRVLNVSELLCAGTSIRNTSGSMRRSRRSVISDEERHTLVYWNEFFANVSAS